MAVSIHVSLLFIITFSAWCSVSTNCWHNNDLKDHELARFENPIAESDFNQFVLNKDDGSIYIAAENAVMRISKSFTLEQIAENVPDDADEATIDANKVLLIDYANQRLITCGSSEHNGKCQSRSLVNLTSFVEGDGEVVVSSAFMTTEAVIAPGPRGEDGLYVVNTYEEDRYGDGKVLPVSRLTLTDEDGTLFASEANIRFQEDVIPLVINYTSAFTLENFTYFVMSMTQQQSALDCRHSDINKDTLITDKVAKLGRVCHKNQDLDSYTEITLRCLGDDDEEYPTPIGAFVGLSGTDLAASMNISVTDEVLFLVFAKYNVSLDRYAPGSALCMYPMRSVEKSFMDAVFGCLSDGDNYKLNYANGSRCENSSVSLISLFLIASLFGFLYILNP